MLSFSTPVACLTRRAVRSAVWKETRQPRRHSASLTCCQQRASDLTRDLCLSGRHRVESRCDPEEMPRRVYARRAVDVVLEVGDFVPSRLAISSRSSISRVGILSSRTRRISRSGYRSTV